MSRLERKKSFKPKIKYKKVLIESKKHLKLFLLPMTLMFESQSKTHWICDRMIRFIRRDDKKKI